jgi:predicted ribonuclease YlaK
VEKMFPEMDVLVMTAAVSDWRPAKKFPEKLKLKKSWTLKLVPNPDILKSVSKKKKNKEKQQTQEEDQKELIQIEALTYIRGRSLPNRYIIVDEAQNLRPLDIKTIITRAGEGTKIVFTGSSWAVDRVVHVQPQPPCAHKIRVVR